MVYYIKSKQKQTHLTIMATKKAAKQLTEWEQAQVDAKVATKRVKALEATLAVEGAKLEQLRETEATIERVVIAPLEAGLAEAKAKLAATEARYAEHMAASADRMAKLKQQLAASKARSKGL